MQNTSFPPVKSLDEGKNTPMPPNSASNPATSERLERMVQWLAEIRGNGDLCQNSALKTSLAVGIESEFDRIRGRCQRKCPGVVALPSRDSGLFQGKSLLCPCAYFAEQLSGDDLNTLLSLPWERVAQQIPPSFNGQPNPQGQRPHLAIPLRFNTLADCWLTLSESQSESSREDFRRRLGEFLLLKWGHLCLDPLEDPFVILTQEGSLGREQRESLSLWRGVQRALRLVMSREHFYLDWGDNSPVSLKQRILSSDKREGLPLVGKLAVLNLAGLKVTGAGGESSEQNQFEELVRHLYDFDCGAVVYSSCDLLLPTTSKTSSGIRPLERLAEKPEFLKGQKGRTRVAWRESDHQVSFEECLGPGEFQRLVSLVKKGQLKMRNHFE